MVREETKKQTAKEARLQKLCMNLVHCESEQEVEKVLRKAGYWDDQSAWRNYGDKENNYSLIGTCY